MKKPKPKNHSGNGKTDGQGADGKGKSDDSTEDEESEEEDSEEENEDGDGKEQKDGKGKDGQDADDKSDDEVDFDSLPAHVQKHIKSLRKENAKYRTKARKLETDYSTLTGRLKSMAGGESDDEESPEQQVERLDATNSSLAFENQTLKLALTNGITDEDAIEWMQFLIGKAVNDLDEGEELDQDALDAITAKVKKRFGAASGSNSTSVSGDGSNGKKADKKTGVTLEQFVHMTVFQKQDLHKKNPDLYTQLFQEAKRKNLLGR
jgi:hypothetical protein